MLCEMCSVIAYITFFSIVFITFLYSLYFPVDLMCPPLIATSILKRIYSEMNCTLPEVCCLIYYESYFYFFMCSSCEVTHFSVPLLLCSLNVFFSFFLFSSCFVVVDDKEQAALHPHSKGNIVGKIVPFTGVLCHGGYCDFKERAKVSVCLFLSSCSSCTSCTFLVCLYFQLSSMSVKNCVSRRISLLCSSTLTCTIYCPIFTERSSE